MSQLLDLPLSDFSLPPDLHESVSEPVLKKRKIRPEDSSRNIVFCPLQQQAWPPIVNHNNANVYVFPLFFFIYLFYLT